MKFDDLIESIDQLSAEEADVVIDWQMTKSPAAKVERGDTEIERCQRDIQEALRQDYRLLMQQEDRLIVNGPHGVRWSGYVNPVTTYVHELGLGDTYHLLLMVSYTTVRFDCAPDYPRNLTFYRIAWSRPDSTIEEVLECAVYDEMCATNTSGVLGRRPIGEGWEAQLGINQGVVKAMLVRYE